MKKEIQGAYEHERLKTTPSQLGGIGRNKINNKDLNKTYRRDPGSPFLAESIEKIEIDETTIRELGLASG